MNVESLHRALAKLLPSERTVLADPKRSMIASLGDCVPRLTVSPQTYDEAREVLRFASRDGLAIVPKGSGTKLAIGNRLKRGDIFLSTKNLEPEIRIEGSDLVAHCSAGSLLSKLQTSAEEYGLQLPLDPPDSNRATLGGLCATASAGPLRTGWGRMRDYVLGMSVMDPDGQRSKSGGIVVKNVTGYDLMKLHIGGLGSLGLITELDLKLFPIPEEDRTILKGYGSIRDAWQDAWSVHQNPGIRPNSLEIFTTMGLETQERLPTRFGLAARLQGSPAAVSSRFALCSFALERGVGEVWDLDREEGRAFFSALSDRRSTQKPTPHLLLVRTLTPPSWLVDWIDMVHESPFCPQVDIEWTLSPALGIADLKCTDSRPWLKRDPHLDQFRAIARRAQGYVRCDAAPLALRDQIDVMGSSDHLALHESIKNAFDPREVFNPGRHLGGI